MNEELNEQLTRTLDALLPGSWYLQYGKWKHRTAVGVTIEVSDEWSVWCATDERRWTAATFEQCVNMVRNDIREEAMR